MEQSIKQAAEELAEKNYKEKEQRLEEENTENAKWLDFSLAYALLLTIFSVLSSDTIRSDFSDFFAFMRDIGLFSIKFAAKGATLLSEIPSREILRELPPLELFSWFLLWGCGFVTFAFWIWVAIYSIKAVVDEARKIYAGTITNVVLMIALAAVIAFPDAIHKYVVGNVIVAYLLIYIAYVITRATYIICKGLYEAYQAPSI